MPTVADPDPTTAVGDGVVSVGTADGVVYAATVADGRDAWTYDAGGSAFDRTIGDGAVSFGAG